MKLVYPAGATPLDPNEIEGLIPNIALQSELNAREEENIIQARRWALSARNRRLQSRILSSDNLSLLHRKMFENVEYGRVSRLKAGLLSRWEAEVSSP